MFVLCVTFSMIIAHAADIFKEKIKKASQGFSCGAFELCIAVTYFKSFPVGKKLICNG